MEATISEAHASVAAIPRLNALWNVGLHGCVVAA
jgi:hypothetical protein